MCGGTEICLLAYLQENMTNTRQVELHTNTIENKKNVQSKGVAVVHVFLIFVSCCFFFFCAYVGYLCLLSVSLCVVLPLSWLTGRSIVIILPLLSTGRERHTKLMSQCLWIRVICHWSRMFFYYWCFDHYHCVRTMPERIIVKENRIGLG